VVALCGVFFALGYMIGRNSTHTAVASVDNTTAPVAAVTPRPRDEEAPPPDIQSTPALAPVENTTPAIQTQPVQETRPVPAPVAAVVPVEAEAGASWLQVAALRHDDAAKLVRTLKEEQLPARLADSPKPDIFRVLVGPYHQTSEVADAKARLKTLGFANAFVQK
jgi:cell division septation protein DedD